MKGEAGFAKLTNMFMNLFLGILVSTVVLRISQNLTPINLFQGAVLAFCVGYTVGDLVPVMSWGYRLAAALNIKNKIGHYFIVAVVLGASIGFFLCIILGFINVVTVAGFTGVLDFIVHFMAIIVAVASVLVLILLYPVMRLTAFISGFSPDDKADIKGRGPEYTGTDTIAR